MDKSESNDCGRVRALLDQAKEVAKTECAELMSVGAREASERMAAVIGCIHEAMRNLDKARNAETI